MDLQALAHGIRIGKLLQQAADLVRNDIVLRLNERRFLERLQSIDPEVSNEHYYLVIAWLLSNRFQESSIYTHFTTQEQPLYNVDELVQVYLGDIGAGTEIPN